MKFNGIVIIIVILALLFFLAAFFSIKKRTLKSSVISDITISIGCLVAMIAVGYQEERIILYSTFMIWIWLCNLLRWIYPKICYRIDFAIRRLAKMPKPIAKELMEDETPERTISIKMGYYSIKIVLMVFFLISLF